MNDVVDAKIVKIIRVNSCAECPYLGTGVSRDIDGNETEYVCIRGRGFIKAHKGK